MTPTTPPPNTPFSTPIRKISENSSILVNDYFPNSFALLYHLLITIIFNWKQTNPLRRAIALPNLDCKALSLSYQTCPWRSLPSSSLMIMVIMLVIMVIMVIMMIMMIMLIMVITWI